MPKRPARDKEKFNTYLKYSGMALQLFVLILIAALMGKKLDAHFNTPKPYITIFLVIFFTSGYMYKLIRDLTR